MKSTLITGVVATGLAIGWGLREAQFAGAAGPKIPNGVVNAADLELKPADFEGKPTGQANFILNGTTPANESLEVGRFLLNPGTEPHTPHRHAEEELLIVTRGSGEIVCGEKKTPVRPGAVMYCDPNVEHGIKNTGTRPLEFYWVKYLPNRK